MKERELTDWTWKDNGNDCINNPGEKMQAEQTPKKANFPGVSSDALIIGYKMG
jgi:hypothetical protein